VDDTTEVTIIHKQEVAYGFVILPKCIDYMTLNHGHLLL